MYDLAIDISRLAVETKVFPLYEVIEGKYIINRKINKPKPVAEYLKKQGRFRHLTEDLIAEIQRQVDTEYDRLLRLAGESV